MIKLTFDRFSVDEPADSRSRNSVCMTFKLDVFFLVDKFVTWRLVLAPVRPRYANRWTIQSTGETQVRKVQSSAHGVQIPDGQRQFWGCWKALGPRGIVAYDKLRSERIYEFSEGQC